MRDYPGRNTEQRAIAKEKGVPVFVDAAAEEPLVPNIHLQHGATLVGYSGGKCMRGPQSSGLLIGQKDLCHAAYFQSAPNPNYGRAFKCSKEETMGLLAAVRQWYKRDHAAEQRAWQSWLQHIESRVQGLPSLTTEYLQPVDLSNRSPRLLIRWDARTLNITGTELAARLDAGTPRMQTHPPPTAQSAPTPVTSNPDPFASMSSSSVLSAPTAPAPSSIIGTASCDGSTAESPTG